MSSQKKNLAVSIFQSHGSIFSNRIFAVSCLKVLLEGKYFSAKQIHLPTHDRIKIQTSPVQDRIRYRFELCLYIVVII